MDIVSPTLKKEILRKFKELGIEFVSGTICSLQDLKNAMNGINTVFHTASLTDPLKESHEFHTINIKGTANVIAACLDCGVDQLIYTSSSAVVDDGSHLRGVEESVGYPRKYLDLYGQTKAEAERIVLAANGRMNCNGVVLSTCALRPHAIFGPRDTHFVAQLIAKVKKGVLTHMIGDGKNLADFTFIDNVVYAHYLAAIKLAPNSKVSGQAYFITNDEPTPFWSFVGRLLNEFGSPKPQRSISYAFAYFLAWFMEYLRWLLGWLPLVNYKPSITRHMVCMVAKDHYFSCEKAKRDLGYSPIVSLEEGLQITVAYFSQESELDKNLASP
jgi:sterol-4alpha-carboxylate 3-dehydrogenase (decarboxylating)